ncbi:MAG TPA: hypothetical protein VGH28_10145 [Polyangiaceae bacterium]|jgi:hypothetical protein
MSRIALFLAALLFTMVVADSPAHAQPPSHDLMAKLGAYAERFEAMRKRASYVIDARLDSVDGHGQATSTKRGKARVDSDGRDSKFSILEYFEDGKNETDEARRKQREREADAARHPAPAKRAWRMPFHPGEQPRYNFDVVEIDPSDASHVRIAFVPKIKEDDTIEGSAWVDARTGTLISAGFKLSHPPTLVDAVNIRMSFGEQTALGPAPSHIEVEARGGFLFVRKRYRGEATLSNYHLSP